MTGELRATIATGETLYGIVLNGSHVYSTVLGYFDAFSASSWGDYAIALSELDTGAGIYNGDLPTPFNSGTLRAIIYQQAGGSPAISDSVVDDYWLEMDEWSLLSRSALLSAIYGVNVNIPDPINARLVGWGEHSYPAGSKISVSGNNITVNFDLEDDNDETYVGWAVWFKLEMAGYPPTKITWLTTVVAQSGNVITVASLPPQDLNSANFTVYLFPPGLLAGGGGGATAEEVAAEILLTPANKIATGVGGAITTVTNIPTQQVRDAMLLAPSAGTPAAESVDKHLDDILEDTGTTLPGTLATIAGYVDTEVAAIKAKTDNLPAAPAATGDIPSAATIADAVLDEAVVGHVIAGSFSKAVVDILDDTSTSLPLAIASITPQSAADIRAEMDTNSTKLAAILADTNELQTDWANGGRLDLILDARASQTSVDDMPTNSELATALSGITASVDQQDIADALLLAPSGAAASGSAMDYLADILEDTGTTLPTAIADLPTAAEIDTELSGTHGDGSWEGEAAAGGGTGYYTDTVTDGASPLDGVQVQLYTAQDRVGLAYEAYTNALGVFEMWPDPGTYYRWLDLAGYSFTQDVEVEVTEP